MPKPFTIPKLSWVIAALLFAITLINYIDRQAMSVLVGQIRDDLHLSEQDYWQIVMLFLIAYAIMYACSGYIVDKIGTKIGMTLFVCAWSVSQMLHGFAMSKWSFAACRFGLGLAEPGSFPGSRESNRRMVSGEATRSGSGYFQCRFIVGRSRGVATCRNNCTAL